jgi:hypothetical protein
MTVQCPTCSRVNPASATYCYYDGRSLTLTSNAAPWWLGTRPFATPFTFSDGQSCGNFDQLAVACDLRWNEARSFLVNGIWSSFFTRIGRKDLAAAAEQAAREADPDSGLASLLECLPTDALRKPTLSLLSDIEDLGTLMPGRDHQFELVISNKGGLVLSGEAATDCDWLFFGDRYGTESRKLFRTRDNYTLVVRVSGNRLRAGLKPLEGRILIATNGGTKAVMVRAMIPVLPFPPGHNGRNVLAGARSPREIAVKAKANPKEAAVLFEQGTVQAWYASNGWIYPIQGSQGKGKGAVQQYFEALGLTKPPTLEINTERIVCRATAGQSLTEQVTVSTKESKFVHAEAHSDQRWIKVQPSQAQGNRVTIPLLIQAPPCPGQSLQARVTVQGNGQQRFVVPVTLTVASAAAPRKATKETSPRSGQRWPLVLAGVAASLVVLLVAGLLAMIVRRHEEVVPPLPPPPGEGGPPPQVAKNEPWWVGIPDQKLDASAGDLKVNSPADCQAIIDRLRVQTDTDRFAAYEELAAKVPQLAGNPKTRKPLARFLTECCVYEPSELNIAQVRRALGGLFPKDRAVFEPEKKGGELEDALYARQILLGAITHKAVTPERARSLADEFGTVFGLAFDTTARPADLAVETEKFLAIRCYRNTVSTARKSLPYALKMRAALLEKFPKHLLPAFCAEVDADLLVVGLGKGGEAWPELEPIFKTCLANNDPDIGLKLVEVYADAEPDLTGKMEGLLAGKWKVAGNARLTKADKVTAIRKVLSTDPGKARISRAERLSKLEKLIDANLSPSKPARKSDIVQLQEALRLAHSSTLSSILFSKEAEIARFDELLKRVPGVEAPAKPVEEKDPEVKPKPPVEVVKAIDVAGKPYAGLDRLTRLSERDPARRTFRKTYAVTLQARVTYTFDMMSAEFTPSVRLESSVGKQLAVASGRAGTPTARITWTPAATGTYNVVATTLVKGATGAYTLMIQQAVGLRPFGPGFPVPPRLIPGNPFLPIVPEQPKPAPKAKEKESQVNQGDLASLAAGQRPTRVAAFKNLVGSLPHDLEAQDAEKIARYLLVMIASDAELEEVSGKLESLGPCRNLLSALADLIASNDKVVQGRTEAVVGGILGHRLRYARDEDWRSATRKLLLQHALDLTVVSAAAATADLAAGSLRDLYKEQGLAFGLDGDAFLTLPQATRVLEELIEHVAARGKGKGDPEKVDRQLKAAQLVADNDLENMVLLQRIWLRVLIGYLQERVPAQASAMQKIQQDLVASDRDSRNLVDQLRVGEEKILRVWALAHDLKLRGGRGG